MEITQEAYSPVEKALTTIEGSPFQLEDITSSFERKPLKPGLLTMLLGVPDEANITDTHVFDGMEHTSQIPAGKSYSGYGPDLAKDKPKKYRFEIPSFGLRFNVAPRDYAGRRVPGTMELMTEEYVIAQMETKMNDAWDLFTELAYAQLLTTDTNIVSGGPFETYNFFTNIVGVTRTTYQGAAKIDMDLGSTTKDLIADFRKQRLLILEELARAGDTAGQIVCLCGDTFFNARYEIEKQTSFGRELRSSLDLMSQALPEMVVTFPYGYFDSHDGIRYINYGSEIIAGTPLIGASDAYLIPTGARKMFTVGTAPSEDRRYVNKPALSMYSWANISERQGVTVWTERNALYGNKNPRAIRHLTTSTTP